MTYEWPGPRRPRGVRLARVGRPGRVRVVEPNYVESVVLDPLDEFELFLGIDQVPYLGVSATFSAS